jgi:hypothetical protein
MRLGLPKLLRPVVIGMSVVLVAACGGTSFKSSAPTASTTTTTVESAETKAWVAAAIQGLMSDPSTPLARGDAACLSRALVDTVTVARLEAGGVTISDLSDPNANFPSGLTAGVPTDVQLRLGEAIQACRFGRLIGGAFTDGIAQSIRGDYRVSAKENECVVRWFDAKAQRQLVADIILRPEPSAANSRSLVRLVLQCLDFAAMIEPSLGLTLSATERACVNAEARTDEQLKSALADEIRGTGTDARASYELFGARVVKCLTPEHILQIGKAKNVPRPG